MPMNRTRRIGISALAALGIFGGSAGIASAVTSSRQASNPPATSAPAPNATGHHESGNHTDHETNDGRQDQADHGYASSIQVPASVEQREMTDAEEQATLGHLAKITSGQAQMYAVQAVPGKAAPAEIGSEDGNLVYKVEITTSKGVVEVTVDAGNGHILANEAGDAGGDHETKAGAE
ncbi:MAG: PepSY domain-containing protein, partial [Actinobacteria bacterium]|nr:PepSY domain-containing protein [Actinomycetota bacterium]